ncbi:Uncharacterised protein [Vibrio cholerae]|nr:Uncharacterised protein [Vibrio cholerae]
MTVTYGGQVITKYGHTHSLKKIIEIMVLNGW